MYRHRRAGRGPAHLAARRRIGAWLVGWSALAMVAVAIRLERLEIATILALVTALTVHRLQERRRRAIAGARTEQRVARFIDRARPHRVVYGLWIPGVMGDLDAVALGPMAAIVEVKSGSGRVRLAGDGSLRVDGHPIHGDPIRRVAGAARTLGRRMGVDFDGIVCVEGMRQRPRRVGVPAAGDPDRSIVLCSARHLPAVLRRLERRVDFATARDLARRLHLADRRPP